MLVGKKLKPAAVATTSQPKGCKSVMAPPLSSSKPAYSLFDAVEITSGTLTGRGGLALVSRYLRSVAVVSGKAEMRILYPQVGHHLMSMERPCTDLNLGSFAPILG